jgi:hypothetical protein
VIANEHAKLTTAGTPVGANVMRALIETTSLLHSALWPWSSG